MDTKKITSTRLLAVEGKDECNFFDVLLQHIGIADVQVWPIGGSQKFASEFPNLYNAEGFGNITKLGFVRDAEGNPAKSAFDSVCGTLKAHSLPVPAAPAQITPPGRQPRVSIFIMPDNQGKGMLEEICLKTIEDRPVYVCVQDFQTCIDSKMSADEKAKFNAPKSRVQAYLAARVPIVNSLGVAARKGYWNLDHASLDDIKDFLRKLFPG
ncbi:MAG: hypothetical protein NTX50_20685 [Candidatus Sumerlaeota bacterium]|nr:hypothetical protein [Candidatus Sumerlaeota bacterium]